MADGVVKMQKTENREQKTVTAQATIEVTLAFVCVLILLFASVKIFIWMAERMVQRQEDYEATRIQAASINTGEPGVYVNESNYPKLDIFGENQ